MNNEKGRKRGKISLIIGLIPFAIALIYILFSGFFGEDICFMVCSGEKYGIEGMKEALALIFILFIAVPYVMIPITIAALILIIHGIRLLKKYPKEKDTKKSPKNKKKTKAK